MTNIETWNRCSLVVGKVALHRHLGMLPCTVRTELRMLMYSWGADELTVEDDKLNGKWSRNQSAYLTERFKHVCFWNPALRIHYSQ